MSKKSDFRESGPLPDSRISNFANCFALNLKIFHPHRTKNFRLCKLISLRLEKFSHSPHKDDFVVRTCSLSKHNRCPSSR